MSDSDRDLSISICVDKPDGLSSAAVVAKIKRHFNLAKVGHAGTLDPNATGILVILTNKACKTQDSFMGGSKKYSGEILLGIETTTDDIWGEVLEENSTADIISKLVANNFSEPTSNDKNSFLNQETIKSITEIFSGSIEQTPPRVSAIKIKGKAAYKRARKGEEFEIKSRQVELYNAEYMPAVINGKYYIKYDIHCSKGTYIRSIARDIGEHLGVGGVAASIRRISSEPFSIENATPLDKLLSISKEELIEITNN